MMQNTPAYRLTPLAASLLFRTVVGLVFCIALLAAARPCPAENQVSVLPLIAAAPDPQVSLTPAEQRYLQKLGAITVCPDPDWPPYEQMDENGTFTGIAADLLKLLEQRLGIRFTYIKARDWDEAVALSQNRTVLILPFLNQTPKRDQWLLFTEPLFIDPNVFITREEHPYITNAALLDNKTIALPGGTAVDEKVRQQFPNLKVLNVGSSEMDVFKAVAERRADLTLRSLTIAAYTIRKQGLFTLKIAGQAPDEFTNRLRIGVHKSEPMLRDILNKGIATISPREREDITNRHVHITVVRPVDYQLILKISAVLALLIALSFYWNLKLKKTNAALAEQEQLWRTIINTSPDGILITSLDGVIHQASERMLIMSGCSSLDELYGRNMLEFVDPAWHQQALERIGLLLQGTYTGAAEYLVNRKDGSQIFIEANAEILRNSNGSPRDIFIIERDVTERKKIELQLRSLSVAIEQSPVSVVITDLEGTIQYVNPQFEKVSGYSAAEAIGQNPAILQSGQTSPTVFTELWESLNQGKPWTGEFINKRKNGEVYYEEAHIAPVYDTNGAINRYVAVKLDITERKQYETKLQHLARYDNLTDLPNRSLFSDLLQQTLALAKREQYRLALMFADLDHFKEINDTYGHAVGDLLLQEAALRMQTAVRSSDIVGRIGGDEFVILLAKLELELDALLVGEKLRSALEQPFLLDGHNITVSSSIGIALFPDHGTTEQELALHADKAMYLAKQAGRNAVRLFSAATA
jgi:diguanylate cyclase (GGDEF)-like protein/PAS domain S-box-containing protein